MTWQPLLDGPLAERALDVARDLAARLTPEAVATSGSSLGSGRAGIAVFHTVLGEALGDPGATKRAVAIADAAVDDVVEQDRLDPTFFGTTVGLSWTLSAAGRRLGEDDPAETDVDELVLRLASTTPWPGHFDVVLGLAGLGAYCLERLPRPSARAALDRVVAGLGSLARETPDGLAWMTTPEIYGPRAAQFPEGHWDLGFAHGNAGVVALLAAATRAGVAGAEPLLRGALSWLLAQRDTAPGDASFPSIIAPDGTRFPSRLAWCYGDPGVAVALLGAGTALGDDGLVDVARQTALRCVGRVEETGIEDASLCHGTAGAGHLLNRLGQALAEERLLDAARFWLARTVEDAEADGLGLVEGAAGAGAALVTAATGADPWWDFPMLLGATG